MWCSGAGGVIGGVGGAGVGVAIGSATVAGAPVAGAAGNCPPRKQQTQQN